MVSQGETGLCVQTGFKNRLLPKALVDLLHSLVPPGPLIFRRLAPFAYFPPALSSVDASPRLHPGALRRLRITPDSSGILPAPGCFVTSRVFPGESPALPKAALRPPVIFGASLPGRSHHAPAPFRRCSSPHTSGCFVLAEGLASPDHSSGALRPSSSFRS